MRLPRPKLLPWRHIVYVYAVAIGFYFAFGYVLDHQGDWWLWVLLVVYVAAAMVLPVRWGRQRRAKT
jgi:hypothetical protein